MVRTIATGWLPRGREPGSTRARRRRARVVGALALGLLPLPALAQAGSPKVSLPDAVERALAQHPSVAAARAGSEGARAEQGEARSAWLPTVSFSMQATHYQEPMLVAPLHGLTPGTSPAFDRTLMQGGPVLSFTLFDGGARGARIRQSGARVSAADAAEQSAVQGLTARVVAGYLDVLARAGALDAHRQRLEALQAEAARVRQLQAVGRAARLEQLRVDAALAGAEAERVRAASALEVAEQELSRLVGAAAGEMRAARLQAVRAAPERLEREALLAAALRENPAAEEARQRIRAADAGVSAARSAYLPRLGVMGSYQSRAGYDVDPKGEWSAGVLLSVPLYTGGATRNRLEQAKAWHVAAEQQARLAELDVARELDRALARVKEAEARIASLEAAVARWEEVVRTEKLALDAGAGVQTDFLRATADLLQAEVALAEARYAAVAARAEVARVTGQLGSEWISNALEVDA